MPRLLRAAETRRNHPPGGPGRRGRSAAWPVPDGARPAGVEHFTSEASTFRAWRKSSYSGGSNGSCLEVSDGHAFGVPVRDAKDPEGSVLVFGVAAWSSFVNALRR